MIVDQISARLALPVPYLLKVAGTASYRYMEYKIDKKSGGKRTIHHPARELKLIQRWLLRNVLRNLPIHVAATAYRPSLNIARNAEKHVAHNYLLRVDFEDFFPSLSDSDVMTVLRANRDQLLDVVSEHDLHFITNVICRFGCLTIGAPTSPHISNAIMFGFDETWTRITQSREVTYTRYADDLYFSTNRANVLSEILESLKEYLTATRVPDLRINNKKTAFSSRKRRRLAAGLVLTSDRKISIGRDKKRMLRVFVNRFKLKQLQPAKVHQLRGWITYVRSVEPTFIQALERKYELDFSADVTWRL